MAKLLKITEADIHRMVEGVLQEYRKDYWEGITQTTNREADAFLREMIPYGNRMSKNTPYKPIRQLLNFFSESGASSHENKGTQDIIKYILKDKRIANIIRKISIEDSRIKYKIYHSKTLVGRALMQEVIFSLDEIHDLLIEFNDAMTKANFVNYFQGSEAIDGRANGKFVGLAKITLQAFKGIGELKDITTKMQELLNNSGRY